MFFDNFERQLEYLLTQLVGTIQQLENVDQETKDQLVSEIKRYGEAAALVEQNKFYQAAFELAQSHRPQYPQY